MKWIPGAKKVGDCCFKGHVFLPYLLNILKFPFSWKFSRWEISVKSHIPIYTKALLFPKFKEIPPNLNEHLSSH